MASRKQTTAAKKNIKKALAGAKKKRSIAHMSKAKRTALGKQAAAVRKRNKTGGKSPKTKTELMKIAQRRKIEGRSKMGRAQLARAVGEK